MKTPSRQILVPRMPGMEAKRQILLSAIHYRWGRFSDANLAAFKDRDGLVAQVAAKYGLARDAAGRDVDALLKGRCIYKPARARGPAALPSKQFFTAADGADG